MSGQEVLDTFELCIILASGFATLAIYFVLCSKAIRVIGNVSEVGSLSRQLFCIRCRSWIYVRDHLWPFRAPLEDKTETRIQELITDYQVKALNAYSLPIALVFSIPPHIILYRFLTNGNQFWHPAQTSLIIVAALIQALIAGAPCCVSRLTISVWFHFMMALLVIFSSFGLEFDGFFLAGTVSCVIRLPLCALYLHVPGMVCWNIISLVVVLLRTWSENSKYSTRTSPFIAAQIVLTFINMLVAYAWSRIVHQAIYQQLQLRCLENSSRATRSLLDMVCDLTVNLDQELVIIDDSTVLAAMLMHRETTSLAGRKFFDFFDTCEDAERFTALVLSRKAVPEQDQSIVTPFHCGLKDQSGNTIKVEAFLTMFQLMSGEARYLVGIREFTDNVSCLASACCLTSGDIVIKKPHHLSEWRGTPSQGPRGDVSFDHSAEEHSSEPSDSSSAFVSTEGSGHSSPEQLNFVLPHLQATSFKALDWVVTNSLLQVNWTFAPSACCHFHESVRQYRSYLKRALSIGCIHPFVDVAEDCDQCPCCGLVFSRVEIKVGEWVCPACESRKRYTDLEPPMEQGTVSSV